MTLRRAVVPVLTAALVGALVLVTVLAARTSDATALGRARPVAALPTATVGTSTSAPPCVVAEPGDSTAGDRLTLSGTCTGTASGTLACTDDDEVLDGSLQIGLTGGATLTLTLVVPGGSEPGAHDDVALFAQVGRDGPTARWATREAAGEVAADGSVSVAAQLTAEPGTGTAGSVDVQGRFRCG